MSRVEVWAGVEVHNQVEPRRHKCLQEIVRVQKDERDEIAFWETISEIFPLTISVEPSLAALRNLFCLSWIGLSR